MLDLRRLRLLRELHERGTIAAVADALQFTPSAVSQQLAMLERETGVAPARARRARRPADRPALVLVEHAARAARARRRGRGRPRRRAGPSPAAGGSRASSPWSCGSRCPAIEALARDAPRLRCEVVEAEPEQTLPALALGDLDLVLGDEWEHQPWRLPRGARGARSSCAIRSTSRCRCAHRSPAATATPCRSAELAGAAWATGHPAMGWEEMTRRTCREHGGFEPDIRHRTNDATVAWRSSRAGSP